MAKLLKQKNEKLTVVVVGASRGIGLATAQYFEAQGWNSLRAARSLSGKKANEIKLDVTQQDSIDEMFQNLLKSKTKVNLFVFSAGVGHFGPIEKLSNKAWDECLSVNLTGAFMFLKSAYKYFLSQKSKGRIYIIGSVADHLALKGNAAYAASKFGLRGLVSVMHEEGRSHGISATLLSLGATYTDIWKSRPEFSSKDMLTPKEVAQTIFNLASLPEQVTIPSLVVTPPKGIL